ncbi:MAG: flagellar export chaperone FlgN [Candidatus Brocadiia bacterium]
MAGTGSESDAAARLIASYRTEAEIYQSLLALSEEQGALLADHGDVDRCAALFERKDQLLRALASIESDIEPLKRQWWGEAVPGPQRERLNALLDAILATIESIMAQEQRNEQLLLQCHGEVEEELGHIQRGTEMHRSTADEPQPQPRFMDIHR